MISIKQTTYNIWWNNEGEDFPTLKLLNEFNASFKDSIYKLNFVNQFTAQVKVKSEDMNISAFKIESSDNFDNQIYIIKSIDRKTSDGIVILNLVVDVFSTYGYKLLELPNRFLTKRTHKFNKLSFQMEDNLLNSLPIYYDKNLIVEKRYKSLVGGSDAAAKINVISKTLGNFITDFQSYINSNIYYVFGRSVNNANDTTKYTLLPYMGDSPSLYLPKAGREFLKAIIFNKNSKWEDILNYIKTIAGEEYTVIMEITPKFSPDISININQAKDYDYENPNNKIEIILPEKIYYWNYVGYLNAPKKYVGYAYTFNTIIVNYYGYVYDGSNEIRELLLYDDDTPILPEKDYPINNTWENVKEAYFEIKLYGQKRYDTSIELKNTLTNINELLKNPDLINKFQGIYFLPNLSNFTIQDPRDITGLFKDFAAVEIGPEGINLSNFSICDQIKLNNQQEYKLSWNNNFITSILFLKYFDITYYSNTKNWNYYFDFDTSSINLSGKFTFNGVGSLVSNTGIDKTYNNIIEFPYQLPSAIDQYIKYYSSIMSTTNTGMEAQKKNYEINKYQMGMNHMLNSLSSAPSIAGSIAGGDLGGMISGAIGSMGSIGNTLLDSQKMDISNEMYYKNLGARFSDVQRSQTTNFSNSAITDLSFIYSNTGKYNAEHVQIKNLTKDTIININNHIYLYGYQNIGWYNWTQLLPYENFNYIEFEHNELVRIILNELDFKVRNIYELVINFWNKGRRLWSKKPNKEDNILIQDKRHENK